MRPSGPCTETMSGEVSASSIERVSAARRRSSAWSRSAWRAGEQLAGAALLAMAWTLSAASADAGEQQPQRDEPGLPVVAHRREGGDRRQHAARRDRTAPAVGPWGGSESIARLYRRARRRHERAVMLLAAARPRPRARPCTAGRPRRARARPGGRAAGARRSASRSAPRPAGAVRTHRFSGGGAPSRRRSRAEAVVQQRGAERAVVLEARRGAARRRASAGTGRCEAQGASSTASSSIATIRSRRRTSSCTRSPSRLEPIVRTA